MEKEGKEDQIRKTAPVLPAPGRNETDNPKMISLEQAHSIIFGASCQKGVLFVPKKEDTMKTEVEK